MRSQETTRPVVIRVLIADDHTLVREGIRDRLNQEDDIEVVGDVSEGDAALKLAFSLRPDVLMLDMEMPGLSGPEVARRLSTLEEPVRILALSAYDDAEYVQELLASGAAGYLTKDETLTTIVAAVRGIGRGEDGWLSRGVAARLMHLQRENPTPDGLPHDLSDREVEVVRAVARGLTNMQIAEHLFISENTVRNHLANVYAKLGVHNRAETVAWAWKTGVVGGD